MKINYLLFLLFLVACNQPADPNEKSNLPVTENSTRLSDLNGKWILIKVNEIDFDVTQLDQYHEVQPYLLIDTQKNKIGGHSGCNAFGGGAKYFKDHFTIQEVEANQQECNDTWEATYFRALRNVEHFQIEGQQLVLHIKANGTLRFERGE